MTTAKYYILSYIESLPPNKSAELGRLHEYMLESYPNARLWFLDGKDANGKVVANPNIGYGTTLLKYANGSQREFYRVGLSANTTGLSVYVMGLSDKHYLPSTFAKIIGKAQFNSYCIKFKSLSDIDLNTLYSAIAAGMK